MLRWLTGEDAAPYLSPVERRVKARLSPVENGAADYDFLRVLPLEPAGLIIAAG
jgi:hypothetical protein